MDTTSPLDAAARRYRYAEAELDKARAELTAEVVAELDGNDKRGAQADVARRTGWSREQIRQVMAQHAKTKKAQAPAPE
ncbi:hypothetical protein HHL19_18730 [Streptomyces sp. R302]|uniref:hypothetical protein n=1 Tax=unclassified Streptomyces TaxID=2593676 RepID=UPI00145E0D19|nr:MULTISPECIES: hypothetical protein [unclassified Streptomyces]NML54785.1 hypothetical protein [Streptomyces sp. R301]NML80646.1 hypothetical protein [Streptomyces sp. R302]